LELPVDPADQVGIGNVANEQEQRAGHLVEPTVAQLLGRQGTSVDVIRLCTCPAHLVISTVVEVPIAFELGASGTGGKLAVDVGPSGSTGHLSTGSNLLDRAEWRIMRQMPKTQSDLAGILTNKRAF
jgi:hypothetical protein